MTTGMHYSSQQHQMIPGVYPSSQNNSFETESDTSYVSSSTSPPLMDAYEVGGQSGEAESSHHNNTYHSQQNNYYNCSTSSSQLHNTKVRKIRHSNFISNGFLLYDTEWTIPSFPQPITATPLSFIFSNTQDKAGG